MLPLRFRCCRYDVFHAMSTFVMMMFFRLLSLLFSSSFSMLFFFDFFSFFAADYFISFHYCRAFASLFAIYILAPFSCCDDDSERRCYTCCRRHYYILLRRLLLSGADYFHFLLLRCLRCYATPPCCCHDAIVYGAADAYSFAMPIAATRRYICHAFFDTPLPILRRLFRWSPLSLSYVDAAADAIFSLFFRLHASRHADTRYDAAAVFSLVSLFLLLRHARHKFDAAAAADMLTPALPPPGAPHVFADSFSRVFITRCLNACFFFRCCYAIAAAITRLFYAIISPLIRRHDIDIMFTLIRCLLPL